jgi:NADP-dependent 3-hydroxy acid dehydrogenase YdfG
MTKSVLITGCSAGGVGDYLAQEFHLRGFKVLASARNTKKIEHLKDLGISIVELDVASKESVKRAVQVVQLATNGTLDILMNNAGVGKHQILSGRHMIL